MNLMQPRVNWANPNNEHSLHYPRVGLLFRLRTRIYLKQTN
jgi:hypothetical protein